MNDLTVPDRGAERAAALFSPEQPGSGAAIGEGPGALLSAIVQLAKDPAFDVGKLDALMKMQERLEDRQAEREFAAALRAAQAELPQIEKHGLLELVGQGGQSKGSYKFARWEDMDKVLRPIMERHGFTLRFDMAMREGGGAVITGTLLHIAGHSASASIPLALDSGPGRNNLQAMGSTMSYGRRYVAEMLFNIVRKGDDDDGVSGGKRFISRADADLLRGLCREAKRQEGPFLDRLFGGQVHSFDEIEAGPGFIAAKNTLEQVIAVQKKRQEAANG